MKKYIYLALSLVFTILLVVIFALTNGTSILLFEAIAIGLGLIVSSIFYIFSNKENDSSKSYLMTLSLFNMVVSGSIAIAIIAILSSLCDKGKFEAISNHELTICMTVMSIQTSLLMLWFVASCIHSKKISEQTKQ